MSAQVAADLRAAAEVLRRDGWAQGTFYDPSTHARCVVGAINYATKRRLIRSHDARNVLAEFLGKYVTVWNDNPGRTADEVIAALDAAADAAERDAT